MTSISGTNIKRNGELAHKEERIVTRKLQVPKSNILVATCTVLMCGIFLAGCSYTDQTAATATNSEELSASIKTDTTEMDEQNEQEKNNSEEGQANGYLEVLGLNQSNDTTGVIYNGVKYYNGYFYYSDPDGFKRIDKDMSTVETLAEGNVRVGNCADNYIYYIRYPADDAQNAGVFRMNLSDAAEEELLAWSEDMWMIQSIYASQNIVYLEKYNICEAYEVNDGRINKIDEKDNVIYQNMDNCNISYEDINELAYGYSSIMLQYHKVVYVDRKNDKVIVYDADSGEMVNTIEQCWSDILVSDRGIVYKDLDYNIWLREWGSTDSKLLYDMAENDNKFVNYGTLDDQCIYGFYEDGNECTLVEIMWEGGCKTGKTFKDVKKAIDLGFSVNNGVISYLQDGHYYFENR